MKVKLQYVINEMDGTEPEPQYVETELEDPVLLNMQFCIEREQYYKLLEACSHYEIDLHKAISDILSDPNPYYHIYD